MTDNEVADVLDQAATLLEERGWCRGAYARDQRGKSVAIHSPKAVKFCLAGALYRVTENRDLRERAGRYVADVVGDLHLVLWSDKRRSKKPVIAVLRKAAEQARAES